MKNGSIKNAAISVIFAEFAAFIFLILTTLISYGNTDPDKHITILGILCQLLGAATCGILCGILNKTGDGITSILSSAMYTSLQLVFTILTSQNACSIPKATIKSILIFSIVFCISKVLSQNRHSKTKKRRIRRKRH